ncbi:unnamed protein product (mitochondrion) [Plasmodiophora brassicae]|uniref:Chitin-binding type-1 domain-containing protein n=1 Tax=Plasmodiophora brassicae TaxID=37360 RepID=A0A3P3Y952_PLABS|nr:unnamed protein product [Plasmodiophora brassicae]
MTALVLAVAVGCVIASGAAQTLGNMGVNPVAAQVPGQMLAGANVQPNVPLQSWAAGQNPALFPGGWQMQMQPYFGQAMLAQQQFGRAQQAMPVSATTLQAELQTLASIDAYYARCRGVMCQSMLNPSVKYYSCDLLYFGHYTGSQCGPNAVPTSDCVGVTCTDPNNQGSTYNSCDLISRGYDGQTCAPGSIVLPRQRTRMPLYDSCEGITCVHSILGMQYTYTSCELLPFGFNGKECAIGFRPKGTCGPEFYNATCAPGLCCSGQGYCGSDYNYCNAQSLNSSSGAPYNTRPLTQQQPQMYNGQTQLFPAQYFNNYAGGGFLGQIQNGFPNQFQGQGQVPGQLPVGQIPGFQQQPFLGQAAPGTAFGQQIPGQANAGTQFGPL